MCTKYVHTVGARACSHEQVEEEIMGKDKHGIDWSTVERRKARLRAKFGDFRLRSDKEANVGQDVRTKKRA